MNDWKPTANIEALKQRAMLIKKIRGFFDEKNYLEVETPTLASYGITDVYLSNLETIDGTETLYLQTSPEYHMKRLLAAGSGPIYQITKAYRKDELGRLHNREFTMLEWYVPGFTHLELIEEVDALLQLILNTKPSQRVTYQTLFEHHCNINPHHTSPDELQQCLQKNNLHGVLGDNEQDKDQYLFLLLSHIIEPKLREVDVPLIVYDFPVSQAALAKINNGIAERFEVYYQGIELANGFNELTDYKEQKSRFEEDLHVRKQKNLPQPPIDENFLAALKQGLPQSAGVALGIDRLIMLALNKPSIKEVTTFQK